MENQSLTSERWRQVKEIFQAAVELPDAERGGYLTNACAGAASLQTEVESLIAAHQQPGSFLDTPAVDLAAAARDQSSLLAGQSFGHYQILSLLSRGGMGEVYRAKDTVLGREVAIKVLPCAFSVDQDRLRRFEQEARAVSALNHPNIITIHEFGQADCNYFIVSELIEGETLRQRTANGPMAPDEIPEVAIQIASALNAAHEAGIVHRDVKPENVMVRPDGLVKVLDFGLAKLSDAPFSSAFETDAPTRRFKTEPGTIMGTVAYMSPEQMRGQELDARSDLFSLGVALYEMAAGQSPFARPTAADVIAAILEKEPPPLPRIEPEVPETLDAIIRKTLRKDREERYQTAAELLADLKSLKNGARSSATMTAKTIGSIGSHSHATFLLVALIAAIAGILYFNSGYFNSGYFNSGNKAIQSIAVLPFVNEGQNPETEYLADGITETLINDLTRLPNLTVRPRNSVFGYQARHKDRELDVYAAGRELNVEAALVGRFAPRGDRIVISLELIDVHDNRLLWGARRERPMTDLLALQADIAREVSEHLRTRLSPEDRRQLAKRYTDNIDAYRAYLRGREAWNRRSREGFAKAIQFYDEAIAIDPNYALAWSGLADCHISAVTYGLLPPGEGFAKAKQAARRALAIDDTLAQAHTSLAHITWLHEWDWAAAERGFKRAIELDPNYPVARQWRAIYLSSMARHNEAIEEIGRAQALDPLSGIIALDAARTLYFARQYDRAIEQHHKAVELAPGLRMLNSWLRMSYEQKELYDRAVEEHLKTLSERGATPETLASFKAAYASAGWQGHWRRQLELSTEELRKRPVSPYFMAEIHARLGDKEQALEWLEKAYEKHSDYLVRLKVDPLFDGLRSEPRFIDLLRRIGLAP